MVSTHYTHNYECDFRNYLFINPFEDVIWNLVQPFEQLYCDERSLFDEQEEKKEKEEQKIVMIDEKKDEKEGKEAPVITTAITNPEFFELLDELETCPDLTTSNEILSNQVKSTTLVSPDASSSLIKNTLEHKRNIPSVTPNDEACNIFKTNLMPTYVENTLMDSVSMQLQFEHSYSKSANSERNSNNNETMSLPNQHEKPPLKSEIKDNCQRELIIRSQMAISILKKRGSKILNNIVQSSTNCSSATNEVQNTENMEKENIIMQNAQNAEKQNIIIQNTQDTEKVKIDPCRKKINIEEYRRRNNKENLFLTEKEKREESTKNKKESCGRPSRSRSSSRNKERNRSGSKNRSRSKRSRTRSRSRTKNKSNSDRNNSRSRSRSKRMSRSRSNSRRISRSKSRNRRMNRSKSRSRNNKNRTRNTDRKSRSNSKSRRRSKSRSRSRGRRSRSNSRNRRSRNRSSSRGRRNRSNSRSRRRSRYESRSRDRRSRSNSKSKNRSYRTRNNSLRSSVSSYNSSTSPTTSSYTQSRSSSQSSGSPQHYSTRVSPSYYKWHEEIEQNGSVERDKTIHVGHLDEKTSERDLRKIFGNFGEVREVRIHSKNSNRYGFVTFWHRNDAFTVWDKKEHPLLEKYNIGFGGRRDFCLSEYSDLDDMKRNMSSIRMSEGPIKRDFMDDLEEFKAIAQKKRKV